MGQLLASLDRAARWVLHGGPGTMPSSRGVLDLACGCYRMMCVLQLFACSMLLYAMYRMERANRQAFLQGCKHRLANGWPHVSLLVQAALHAVVCLQLFGMVWVLAFSDSRGGGAAASTQPAAAPEGAAVLG